jgi:hypothetical protein
MPRPIRGFALALALAAVLAASAGRASAQAVIVTQPAVSYYYAPPVVSYFTPPAVSYYYTPPAVSYYAPPVVSYSPAVVTYPAGETVTTYRYRPLLHRTVVVTRYYP